MGWVPRIYSKSVQKSSNLRQWGGEAVLFVSPWHGAGRACGALLAEGWRQRAVRRQSSTIQIDHHTNTATTTNKKSSNGTNRTILLTFQRNTSAVLVSAVWLQYWAVGSGSADCCFWDDKQLQCRSFPSKSFSCCVVASHAGDSSCQSLLLFHYSAVVPLVFICIRPGDIQWHSQVRFNQFPHPSLPKGAPFLTTTLGTHTQVEPG